MRILVLLAVIAATSTAHASRCEQACAQMSRCKLSTSYDACVTRCRDDGIESDPEGAAHLDTVARSSCEALAPSTKQAPEGEIEADYAAPPGYTASRSGAAVVFTPAKVADKTACIYGLLPARPSTGSLETDARNAVLESLPGWQRGRAEKLARGTAPDGWPYAWVRSESVSRANQGQTEYGNAIAMAFPATSGRVNIVFGYGSNVRCMGDDAGFERLFHSLRPRGWKSDGGAAYRRQLAGTWRLTAGSNRLQYSFRTDGRYMNALHTQTTVAWTETTRTGVGDGSWSYKDGFLVLAPDRKDRGAERIQFRVYEKQFAGSWWRVAAKVGAAASDEPTEYDFIPGGK